MANPRDNGTLTAIETDNVSPDPMAEAEAWLCCAGIRFERKTDYQLKVGSLSYYPRRGSIFVDGEKKQRSQRGLSALKVALRELGILPPGR